MSMTSTVAPIGVYANIAVAGTVGVQNRGNSPVVVSVGAAAPVNDVATLLLRPDERETFANIVAGETLWVKTAGTSSVKTNLGQDDALSAASRVVVWS